MRYIFLLSLILSSFVSCSKVDEATLDGGVDGVSIEVAASYEENPLSRVISDGGLGYLWHIQDEIAVYPVNAEFPVGFYVKEGSMTNEAGEATITGSNATFQGVLTEKFAQDGKIYATYPVDYKQSDVKNYNLDLVFQNCSSILDPEALTYSAGIDPDNSLFLATAEMQNGSVPAGFNFEQQCALLKLKLKLPQDAVETAIKSTEDLRILVHSDQLATSATFDLTQATLTDRITARNPGSVFDTYNLTLEGDHSGATELEVVMTVLPTAVDAPLKELNVIVMDKHSAGLLKYVQVLNWKSGDVTDIVADGGAVAAAEGLAIEANHIYTLEAQLKFGEVTEGEDESFPIKITSAEELKQLAADVNGGKDYEDVYIRLENDIDLSGEEWIPMGGDKVFKGNFNGNNKTIKGMTITKMSGANIGFIGTLGGGYVKNLTVDGIINVNNYTIVVDSANPTITTIAPIVAADCFIGGVVGKVSAGTIDGPVISTVDIEYTNLTEANATVVGGVFGTFASNKVHLSSSAFISYGISEHIPEYIKVTANNAIKVGGVLGNLGTDGLFDEGSRMEYWPSLIYVLNEAATAKVTNVGGLVGYCAGKTTTANVIMAKHHDLSTLNDGGDEGLYDDWVYDEETGKWQDPDGNWYDALPDDGNTEDKDYGLIHVVAAPKSTAVHKVNVGGLIGQGATSSCNFSTWMEVSMTTELRAELSNKNGDTVAANSWAYVGRIKGENGTNTGTVNKYQGSLVKSEFDNPIKYAGCLGICKIAGSLVKE